MTVFRVAASLLAVEQVEDVGFARERLKMEAVLYDELSAEAIAGRNVLVVTETADEGLRRLREVIAGGVSPLNACFVDIGYGTTLRTADLDDVRLRFRRPKDFLWDNTRFMDGWPTEEPLTTHSPQIDHLDANARWTVPEVAVLCGGYGSGKSTIAQMMALALANAYGWPISICAWEDRRRSFRDRLWRTAIGMGLDEAATTPSMDARAAVKLEKLVSWTEPLALNERALAAYFERIRFLTGAYGVKVHVCDPSGIRTARSNQPGSYPRRASSSGRSFWGGDGE